MRLIYICESKDQQIRRSSIVRGVPKDAMLYLVTRQTALEVFNNYSLCLIFT